MDQVALKARTLVAWGAAPSDPAKTSAGFSGGAEKPALKIPENRISIGLYMPIQPGKPSPNRYWWCLRHFQYAL